MESLKFNMDFDKYERLAKGAIEELETEQNCPINSGETFEPCLRGMKKIAERDDLKSAIIEVMEDVFKR